MKQVAQRKFIGVVGLICCFCLQASAEARLGESISSFKQKSKKNFELKEVLIRDEKKYYSFVPLLSEDELRKAPGFKAGMTVTVKSGKIIGQSLALCLGSNNVEGSNLALLLGHNFACETLGRRLPKEDQLETEKNLVRTAIIFALAGQAQELKFPDSMGKIVFKKDKDGNLLVAAVN